MIGPGDELAPCWLTPKLRTMSLDDLSMSDELFFPPAETELPGARPRPATPGLQLDEALRGSRQSGS